VAGSDELLTPEEIEALMSAARGEDPPPPAAAAPPAAGKSDLLNADDISALFQQTPAAPPAKSPAPPVAAPSDLLSADDISALFSAPAAPPPKPAAKPAPPRKPPAPSPAEASLRQAEQHLAAAVAPDVRAPRGLPPELGEPRKFEYASFDSSDSRSEAVRQLGSLQDVELDLRVELGRTELLIEEVMKLREGSVVPLDKLAGDPVDIFVNGRMVARGEVLVLNDNFCVRVAEILTPEM
jgi:flagellar motor switch protein FliN/FliY